MRPTCFQNQLRVRPWSNVGSPGQLACPYSTRSGAYTLRMLACAGVHIEGLPDRASTNRHVQSGTSFTRCLTISQLCKNTHVFCSSVDAPTSLLSRPSHPSGSLTFPILKSGCLAASIAWKSALMLEVGQAAPKLITIQKIDPSFRPTILPSGHHISLPHSPAPTNGPMVSEQNLVMACRFTSGKDCKNRTDLIAS